MRIDLRILMIKEAAFFRFLHKPQVELRLQKDIPPSALEADDIEVFFELEDAVVLINFVLFLGQLPL